MFWSELLFFRSTGFTVATNRFPSRFGCRKRSLQALSSMGHWCRLSCTLPSAIWLSSLLSGSSRRSKVMLTSQSLLLLLVLLCAVMSLFSLTCSSCYQWLCSVIGASCLLLLLLGLVVCCTLLQWSHFLQLCSVGCCG